MYKKHHKKYKNKYVFSVYNNLMRVQYKMKVTFFVVIAVMKYF